MVPASARPPGLSPGLFLRPAFSRILLLADHAMDWPTPDRLAAFRTGHPLAERDHTLVDVPATLAQTLPAGCVGGALVPALPRLRPTVDFAHLRSEEQTSEL